MSSPVGSKPSFILEAPRASREEAAPSIDARDENGQTPLTRAVSRGDLARVESLIDAKADLERAVELWRKPFWQAAIKLHFNIATRLFDAGASVPPFLWWSRAACNDTKVIRGLLQLGANPNLQDFHNPLYGAVTARSLEVVQLLLEDKADPHCVVNKRYTPLLLAYELNHTSLKIVRLLEEVDRGFTHHLITLRLAGHRFSLAGKLYENLTPWITFPAFAHTLDRCAQEDWSSHSWKAIPAESLRQAVNRTKGVEEYFLDWKAGKMVTFKTGVVKHSIALVLFQKWLAMGNCGFGAQIKGSGLHFYEIGSDKRMKEVIDSLLKLPCIVEEAFDRSIAELRDGDLCAMNVWECGEAIVDCIQQETISFFQEEIHALLELLPFYSLPLNPQIRNNCGYVAAKLSALAILTFLHFDQERSMEEAVDLAYPIYDAVIYKDCAHALRTLYSLEKKEPRLQKITSFKNLFARIGIALSDFRFRERKTSHSMWRSLSSLHYRKMYDINEEAKR